MGVKGFLATVLVTTCTMSGATAKATDRPAIDERVRFELNRAPMTPFQKQRLPAQSANLAQGTFTGRLRIPKATTRVPAAVLVHTCHDERHYLPWMRLLNSWGFATLSYSRCQPPDNAPDDSSIPSLDWKRGALIAYSAFDFLRSRPEIDDQAIVVIGWSRLGAIPLSVLNYEGAHQFHRTHFAAGIALYPFCSFARGPHAGPLLVITAGRDDYVDPAVCERMASETRGDKFPVTLKAFSGVWHGFDMKHYGERHFAPRTEINPDAFSAGGGTVGYDAAAHAAAVREVRRFLEQTIGRQRIR